jgi:spore coat protein U-like protein
MMKHQLAMAAMVLLAPVAAGAGCVLAHPPDMILGPYTGATATSGASNTTVSCSRNSKDYDLSLDEGHGVGATTSNRKLTGPASATLAYGLFQDAARSRNWGNRGDSDTVSGSGSVATSVFTIYPRIAGGQLVAPGTYSDSITMGGQGIGTRNFNVTAVVQAGCQITATNIDFGIYTGAALDSVGTLSITCTRTTPYYVNLGDGMNRDGNYLPRAASASGDLLSYTMFQDAARSHRWGNTYNFDGVAGTGTGALQSLTVYGRVLADQTAAPGVYTDTVIATITY